MPKYKVYIEIGVHLDVESDREEDVLTFVHGALQVGVLPGYNVEEVDKYIVEESYQRIE